MSEKREHSVIEILEFDSVLKKLSGYTVSPEGKASIEALFPFTNREMLELELTALTEMKDILEYDDPFPLTSFSDIRPLLMRIGVIGSFLQTREFVALDEFMKITRRVKDFLADRIDKAPRLVERCKSLVPLQELERAIGHVIDASGEMKANASETLSKIRKEIGRITRQIRKRLDAVLRDMIARGYAQEDGLVLRDGRLVIPMIEGHRGRLKGVIVDQSASGATVFMEPFEVLEANNEIRHLLIKEKQEIERILIGLTDECRPHLETLEENLQIAGQLDSLMARARLSIELEGIAARVSDDGVLELKDARHPLLLMRKARSDVVPLSLVLGASCPTLIITGPNAGGKTVALKTVGLLAMMHRYGLHVPANPDTSIPVFHSIFADIGDFQSIEQDLSTFSSHIENIKMIQQEAGPKSLVLVDEIGAATDPVEGAALAEVIIRYLTRKGCATIVTTHMGSLKAFAHEESGVENGSLIFDSETLCPTYRFQMGIPGSSYAFEIANRLGLSKRLIKEARDLVGEERGHLDRLILHLEEQLRETQSHLREAEKEESRLAGLVKLYGELSDRLQKEGDTRKQEILREAEDLLKDANATVERVVKEIREKNAGKQSIQEAKKQIQSQRKKVESLSKKRVTGVQEEPVKKGDWVSWKAHKKSGEVVSDPDSSGRVFIQLDGLKLRISVSELLRVSPPDSPRKRSGMSRYSPREAVHNEVDLRGMTAEEAVEALERYLGEARNAGHASVCIIHGKGTGVLRSVVGRHLKGHALVKTQRLGNWNEGDTGVTIVELS